MSAGWEQKVKEANASHSQKSSVARGQLNNAIGYAASNDNFAAQRALARAFTIDPELLKNQEARALAASLTGKPTQQAAELLAAGMQEKKAAGTEASDLSCMVSIAELFILYVATVVVSLLAVAVTQQVKTGAVIDRSVILETALGEGAVGLIALLFQTWLTHISSLLIGGEGLLPGLVGRLLPIQIVTTLLSIVPLGLLLWATHGTESVAAQMSVAALLVEVAIGIGAAIGFLVITMRTYKFGILRALIATVILPPFLMIMTLIVIVVIRNVYLFSTLHQSS